MLIVGCGDVGRKIAARAQRRGESVRCLVRSVESAASLLRRPAWMPSAVDLDQQSPALRRTCPTRGRSSIWRRRPRAATDDPRMRRFLAALSTPANVTASSISAPPACMATATATGWTSTGRPIPQVDRARRRHDAEQQLRAWREAGRRRDRHPARCRDLRPRQTAAGAPEEQQVPMIGDDEAPWTNRIHIDDLVTVCEAAMAHGIGRRSLQRQRRPSGQYARLFRPGRRSVRPAARAADQPEPRRAPPCRRACCRTWRNRAASTTARCSAAWRDASLPRSGQRPGILSPGRAVKGCQWGHRRRCQHFSNTVSNRQFT